MSGPPPAGVAAPGLAHRVLDRLSEGRFLSGEALGAELGVSRAAVWKAVATLRADGYPVESVSGRGYRLEPDLRPLRADRLRPGLVRELDCAVEVTPRIESTNTALLGRLHEPLPRALFAERQTAGRGRWGRRWESDPGAGIYFSCAWPFRLAAGALASLSLVVAVHLADRLARLGIPDLGIKWPNDLLSGEGKLGGILVELSGETLGPCPAVVGVGINWRAAPDLGRRAGRTAVGVADVAGSLDGHSREALAGELLEAVCRACLRLERGLDDDWLSRQWQRYDRLRGRAVRVTLPGGGLEGVARGIDRDGALLLETPEGLTRLWSGEPELRVRP